MTLLRISYGLPTFPQPDRLGMLIAYDESRRELWGFGGQDAVTFAPNQELWRWRVDEPEKGWVFVPILGPLPPARSDSIWVFDSSRNVFYAAGGADVTFTFLTDTWKFDPGALAWTDLTPSGTLNPRFPQEGAYDKARDRIVRFGGVAAGFIVQQDTQEYNPETNAWSTPTLALPSPPARFIHSSAYDDVRQLFVIHGGTLVGAVDVGDTWVYPVAGEWAQQASALTPNPRRLAAMAYHPRLRGIHLSHGTSAPASVKGTWLLTADGYRELFPTAEPAKRDQAYASRVDALGVVAMQGGVDQANPPFPALVETQLFDRFEEWTKAPIGLDFDRDEIEVDGGARLPVPATTPTALIRSFPIHTEGLDLFEAVSTIPAGDKLLFAFEVDGQAKWFDGALATPAWVNSDLTELEMNPISTVAANLNTLDLTSGPAVVIVARLDSDTGATTPELEQVEIEADLLGEPVISPRQCLVFAQTKDFVDGDVQGAVLRLIGPSGGFFHGDTHIRQYIESVPSGPDGRVELDAFETETISQSVTLELVIGGTITSASVEIPDQDKVNARALLSP